MHPSPSNAAAGGPASLYQSARSSSSSGMQRPPYPSTSLSTRSLASTSASATRSAVTTSVYSTPPRPVQRLTAITAKTPISLIKQEFSAATQITWTLLSAAPEPSDGSDIRSFAQRLTAVSPFLHIRASTNGDSPLPPLLRQSLFYVQSNADNIQSPSLSLWIFRAEEQPDVNSNSTLRPESGSEQCRHELLSELASIGDLQDQHRQALLRLAASARFDRGSYPLAHAAPSQKQYKGKHAMLSTSDQQAHSFLLRALKRQASWLVTKQSTSVASPGQPLRLLLKDSVVFARLPHSLHNLTAALSGQHTDEYSIQAEYSVTTTSDSLYIHATCCKLPGLPLPPSAADKVTPLINTKTLLTPLGWQVDTTALIDSSALSKSSISSLQSAFAPLAIDNHVGQAWIVCTIPNNDSSGPSQSFLWPAALCLAVRDGPHDSNALSRHLLNSDLETSIPLKELASFTLKMLQNADAEAKSPYAPGEDDNFEPVVSQTEKSPMHLDSFDATYSGYENVTPAPRAQGPLDVQDVSDADNMDWMQQIVGMSASNAAMPVAPYTEAADSQHQQATKQIAANAQSNSDANLQKQNGQLAQRKTQAGSKDRDAFTNLDLLTEDDFSFFDSGAFGLEPSQADYTASAAVHELFGRETLPSQNAADSVIPVAQRPAPLIEDFAMSDVDQSSLDALFNTIPPINDTMLAQPTSRVNDEHMRSGNAHHDVTLPLFAEPHMPTLPVSASAASISSTTPREAGPSTLGDPASLPAFTPSSLTESSPAFGNHSHKTPRTPHSPNDEFRDDAAVISAHDLRTQHGAHAYPTHYGQTLQEDDKLKSHDPLGREDRAGYLRPFVIPLPTARPHETTTRNNLQNRARVGSKYDQRGKFGSEPKIIGAIEAASPPIPRRLARSDHSVSAEHVRQLPPHSRGLDSRQSPSSALTRKARAVLQLRMSRHKLPPGSNAHYSRAQYPSGLPYSPSRSTNESASHDPADMSESDNTSSDDDTNSDGFSELDPSTQSLAPSSQEQLIHNSIAAVSKCVAAVEFSGQPRSRNVDKACTPRLSIKPWMLSKTCRWLVDNPQFRYMYGTVRTQSHFLAANSSEIAEALDALLVAVSDTHDPPSVGDLTREQGAGKAEESSAIQVLEPAKLAVGCQGSVLEALPSSLGLWDKTNFSAVGGPKHVMAMVLLTHASAAWLEEIAAWLDRMKNTFETFQLGSHHGDQSSILAVADELESGLSSYLDKLIRDSDTWLDTLRSISSRIQVHLLQGNHVVLYTMQSMSSASCHRSGFHGLLRFETDLRELLRDQVGALSEHFVVRPIASSMITESASVGFGQQYQSLRSLAFSVYDQLRRVVRRQPGKVLHGRETGPMSASIQFPAFTLLPAVENRSRSLFALVPPEEVTPALGDKLLLHIGYTTSDSGNKQITIVSSIDDRGSSYTVDAWPSSTLSTESQVETVWRFALAQASKASIKWRLVIAKSDILCQRELEAWSSIFERYCEAKQRGPIDRLCLLSIRTDETGMILAERGQQVRSAAAWNGVSSISDKTSSILLKVSDLSQVIHPRQSLPLDWTCNDGSQDAVVPTVSSILTHTPSSVANVGQIISNISTDISCHTLAVDLLLSGGESVESSRQLAVTEADGEDTQSKQLGEIVGNLHELRLLSTERHQLSTPWAHLPWHIGIIQMLQAHLSDLTIE